MLKKLFIKKIVASALLVVFAISITPTIVFHNWLADHTDTFTKATNEKGEQLGRQTFNCQCDHVVAESPFTNAEKTIIPCPTQPFSSSGADLQVQYLSLKHFFYALRGPPAV